MEKHQEVREMRNAETALAIIRDRGTRQLPLEGLYRMLYNPDLYLRAYARLYPNRGALTPGSTPETADGMSRANIDQLIDDLRHERFRWTPVRRVYIPKKNGKQRPLGIPSWRDKLLQEVLRSILEAYYDPQFSTRSHGFRPGRGCHTALQEIQTTWTGTIWFIEGDIKAYFDTIDHDILMGILGERIHDNRFLQLLRQLLQAGYVEEWNTYPTLSGAPQGGIVSPLLANIYLDRFDQYVEQTLIPAYTKGTKRKTNPAYSAICTRIRNARRNNQPAAVKALRKQQRQLPSVTPMDPAYRRLRYLRYADDFVLGLVGTRQEADHIKQDITAWLKEQLKLTLSEEKTLITNASNAAARFLGYEIVHQRANDRITPATGRRQVNGRIGLRVPSDVIQAACDRYSRNGKPIHRRELIDDTDFSIIARYQQEYRGIVQYYALAQNVCNFNRLEWVMKTSLLKTLASKHQASVRQMGAHYETTIQTPTGPRKVLEIRVERADKPSLVARFGGIARTRQPFAAIRDLPLIPKEIAHTEILYRLQAEECELCGAREQVEVHHVRKLADLKVKGRKERPFWVKIMAKRRRKTLVVCSTCHDAIHAGRPTRQKEVTI